MKKPILFLSLAVLVGSNLYSEDTQNKYLDRVKTVKNILVLLFKPFSILDDQNPAMRERCFDAIQAIQNNQEYDKEEYANQCRFDPRYRNWYKLQHLKGVNSAKDVQQKHMTLVIYGPLCEDGRYITKKLHSSPGAYIATGFWYTALITGSYQGITTVRNYLKKRNKRKQKAQIKSLQMHNTLLVQRQ